MSAPVSATKPGCDLAKLNGQAHAIEHGLRSLQHSEQLAKLQQELTALQERRALFDNYIGEGGLLSFPNVYLFIAAIYEAKRQDVLRSFREDTYLMSHFELMLKKQEWGPLLELTADLLDGLLSSSWLHVPQTPADAELVATQIANATFRLKEMARSAFTINADIADRWVTPEATRALARAFFRVKLVDDAPALQASLFDGAWKVAKRKYLDDIYWKETDYFEYLETIAVGGVAAKAGQLLPPHLNPAEPVPVLRTEPLPSLLHPLRRRQVAAENEKRVQEHLLASRTREASLALLKTLHRTALRKELEDQIAAKEKEISELAGQPPREREAPASLHYEPSEELKLTLGNPGGSDVIATVLKFKADLRAKYLREGSFFTSRAAELLRAHSDGGYPQAFEEFDPKHIPQERAEGGYDEAELAAFRDRLKTYQCTAAEFLKYSHELHELKKHQREYDGLLKVLKDARNGFLEVKALELYQTAPHELPPAYEPPKPPVTTAALAPVPFVAMRTAPAVYHRALTWMAREISARNSRVQGELMLGPLRAAAGTLPMEAWALSRSQVIDTLAPALEHALEQSRLVLSDYIRMQADLRGLQENQSTLLARKLAELEAHRDAGDIEAGRSLAEIDALELELNDLNQQVRTAQHLHDSLTLAREQLRERRDFLQRLAEFLHHVDPLDGGRVRTETLRPAIEELNRLAMPAR